jgi:hypothetical protein
MMKSAAFECSTGQEATFSLRMEECTAFEGSQMLSDLIRKINSTEYEIREQYIKKIYQLKIETESILNITHKMCNKVKQKQFDLDNFTGFIKDTIKDLELLKTIQLEPKDKEMDDYSVKMFPTFVYQGSINNLVPHGHGRAVYKNETKHAGEFIEGIHLKNRSFVDCEEKKEDKETTEIKDNISAIEAIEIPSKSYIENEAQLEEKIKYCIDINLPLFKMQFFSLNNRKKQISEVLFSNDKTIAAVCICHFRL